MKIQVIEHNGIPEYAVIPYSEWAALNSRLEDLEDISAAREVAAGISSGEETFPLEFVERLLLSQENPLKVWRDHRGLTLAILAKTCGVSAAALSQIENGKRSPSVELLRKLSIALRCDMEDLLYNGDAAELH